MTRAARARRGAARKEKAEAVAPVTATRTGGRKRKLAPKAAEKKSSRNAPATEEKPEEASKGGGGKENVVDDAMQTESSSSSSASFVHDLPDVPKTPIPDNVPFSPVNVNPKVDEEASGADNSGGKGGKTGKSGKGGKGGKGSDTGGGGRQVSFQEGGTGGTGRRKGSYSNEGGEMAEDDEDDDGQPAIMTEEDLEQQSTLRGTGGGYAGGGNIHGGGNVRPRATPEAIARMKKESIRAKEDIKYDRSQPDEQLPVGIKMWNLYDDQKFHPCKVLDRQSKAERAKFAQIGSQAIAQATGGIHKHNPNISMNNFNKVIPPGQKKTALQVLSDYRRANNIKLPGNLPSDEQLKRHEWLYYIHYINWDRRMDMWTTRENMCFVDEVEPALSVKHAPQEDDHGHHDSASASSDKKATPLDAHTEVFHQHGNFTEHDVRAHEQATKVKNVDAMVIGPFEVSTWYYSPLPMEYNKFEKLYFCEFCLFFFGYPSELKRHMRSCTLNSPPGVEIYRSEETNVTVSVFEVDGLKEQVYCENLCYIAKMFLDHKTLEYDCSVFLFYIICEVTPRGHVIVGYFSKEKQSAAKYNLACILTLPCHQRKGYGKFIISLSYELSKLEEKIGSPEKPISDLGKVSYLSYWSRVLIDILATRLSTLEQSNTESEMECVSIEQLSRMTSITTADIIETLKWLKILQWHGKWVVSSTMLKEVLQERDQLDQRMMKKIMSRANPAERIYVAPCRAEKLHWSPFVLNVKKRDHGRGGGER